MYPLFLREFNKRSIFKLDFRNNSQKSGFVNICPAEPSCFTWPDRQTDMRKLIVANNSVSKVARQKAALHEWHIPSRGIKFSLHHSVECCFGVHLAPYLIEDRTISQGFKHPKCELSLQFSSYVFRTPFINRETLPRSTTDCYKRLQLWRGWTDELCKLNLVTNLLKERFFERYLRYIKFWWGNLKEINQFEPKSSGILRVVDRHGRFGKKT